MLRTKNIKNSLYFSSFIVGEVRIGRAVFCCNNLRLFSPHGKNIHAKHTIFRREKYFFTYKKEISSLYNFLWKINTIYFTYILVIYIFTMILKDVEFPTNLYYWLTSVRVTCALEADDWYQFTPHVSWKKSRHDRGIQRDVAASD